MACNYSSNRKAQKENWRERERKELQWEGCYCLLLILPFSLSPSLFLYMFIVLYTHMCAYHRFTVFHISVKWIIRVRVRRHALWLCPPKPKSILFPLTQDSSFFPFISLGKCSILCPMNSEIWKWTPA